jgi:diguanylate cyclase
VSALSNPSACGAAAIASMTEQGVVPTPENFSIWYEYHSGLNPQLSHVIDLLLQNAHRFDADVLASIHKRFFDRGRERDALQQASARMLALLQEVGGVIEHAGAGASSSNSTLQEISAAFASGTADLPALINRLCDEARELTERTEHLGQSLVGASERIQSLERSLQQVQRDAATDALTGLHNRRTFDAKLREAAGHAMNSGEPLSLALFDVDHFKRVNDIWGHQTGDQVLRLVATTLAAQIRPTDIAARYGGEEFGVILPATPSERAAAVSHRIRRVFEGRRVVARTSGKSIDGVTVSAGVACYDPGEPLSDWVERADKALYAAKKAGRNQVMVSG